MSILKFCEKIIVGEKKRIFMQKKKKKIYEKQLKPFSEKVKIEASRTCG